MSIRRLAVMATIIVVALVVAPVALAPGVSSADVLVAVAPLKLVVVGLWPRREHVRRRVPWITDIDEDHPAAVSRLDRMDGVGTRRLSP